MSEPGKAVFLSYASQDAAAALRLCAALRAAGVEVWFDQNELVGGDAWDAKIRKQIAECALFVPVISAATQARTEGYFRLEWKLAAQRTHTIADDAAFLLPVVIDETRDADARVPAEFKSVQWTRLPGAEAPEKFCARVQSLLGSAGRDASPRRPSSAASDNPGRPAGTSLPMNQPRRFPAAAWISAAALVAIGALYIALRPEKNASTEPYRPTPQNPAAPPTEVQKMISQIWAIYAKQNEATREDWALAAELGAQATKLEPANADAWAASAQAILGMAIFGFEPMAARASESLKLAQRAISLTPQGIEARFALANCYRRRPDNVAEAERMLRDLLQEVPNDQRILLTLASTYRAKRRFDDALALVERAAKVPGAQLAASYGRLSVYRAAGRMNDWADALDQMLDAFPQAYASVYKLYVQAVVRDDLKGAAQTLERMPRAFLLREEGAYIASRVSLWLGNYERCLATLDGVAPDFFDTLLSLGEPVAWVAGEALAAAGRNEAARTKWQMALVKLNEQLRAKPDDTRALWWKARVQAALGERASAEETLALYVQFSADDAGQRFRRAAVAVTLGKPSEAMVQLQAALRSPSISKSEDSDRADFDPLNWLAMLRRDSLFTSVRNEPGFANLLDQLAKRGPVSIAIRSESPAKSVAVLAFKNLSGDPAREFFSDGLSEAVTDVLGRVPGLKVVGSASAFSFKGKSVPIPEIARQLGVTHLVDGTVIQDGPTVRITAKLIQADGFQVWVSDKLDRELKNIFALHDEVAGLIAKNLSLKLGASSAASKTAVDPEAFELYVQARRAWNLRTAAEYARAEQLLTRSLQLEPRFARAHAALADVWQYQAYNAGKVGRFDQRSSPLFAVNEEKVREALLIDPTLGEAHASLGNMRMDQWKFAESAEALRAAIALNPNYASAHHWLSRTHLYEGRMDEALREIQIAADLDPYSARILSNHAETLRYAGRVADALTIYQRALGVNGNEREALQGKVRTLADLGQFEQAITLADDPANAGASRDGVRMYALLAGGRIAEAERVLAQSPTLARSLADRAPYLLKLGRTEEVLSALETSEVKTGHAAITFFSPEYDAIRDDPRFVKFLATLGRTEAHARAQAWRAAHPPEKPAK